ncbi:Acetyltransferase (GNAT) family protein [Asanoa hainanensis]|uniref:Acetyltransferase (GNAT) family protein n=1 Tax=Asanoa hainanensis TaxID=560556 RepID=A0A239P3T8_9ACTN|nr:GNAT family N-acetyltransferase [Asanoa hainanensis]SNT61807.1 Acetyltransferase (GNAT) family protein [Asanoa hainanensis]
MDHAYELAELTPEREADVAALCRMALDLPSDSIEADQIVDRLRSPGPVPGSAGERRITGWVALLGSAVVGVVLGSTGYGDPSVGHVDLIAVHPEHRRHGIGRALLARAEASLAEFGATSIALVGNAPVYAWPGIDVRYTAAVCLAEASGYARADIAWNMTADLTPGSPALAPTTEAEARLASAGVAVRRAVPADVPGLAEFAAAEFGPGWGAEVAASEGIHYAVRDGAVLGFACWGSSRPSYFGPMGTAAAARGLGVGGVLLRRCLREQHAAGLSSAQIGWVGPVPFYSTNSGARIERVFFLYRRSV